MFISKVGKDLATGKYFATPVERDPTGEIIEIAPGITSDSFEGMASSLKTRVHGEQWEVIVDFPTLSSRTPLKFDEKVNLLNIITQKQAS